MKHILCLLILCAPAILPAQNYQNICTPGISFYKNSAGSIRAFRLDSTDIALPPDTMFYSFRSIRDTMGVCLDTTGGSFLGLMITKKPSGVFQFINKYNELIIIHTTEGVGFSWELIALAAGAYIEASINALVTDIILGTIDSVKVIELQAKDNTGTPIPHILNGQQIKLSKHCGLVCMLEVYSIPYISEFYSLLGKTSPSIGMQNITWNEVYDYSIGDVFHYSAYQVTMGVTVTYKIIKTVLNKEEIPDSNKVIYTFETCQKMVVGGPPPNTFYSYDTVSETIIFQSDTSYINEMPQEFIRTSESPPQYARVYPEFNGRQTHQNIYGIGFGAPPPCWHPPFEYSSSRSYTTGLGRTRYSTSEQFEQYSIQLVYFKKGTEIWGTPVSTNCNTLVSAELQQNINETQVSIYPNPANDKITIQISGNMMSSPMEFRLMDLLGKEVYRMEIPLSRYAIILPPLPSGLYVWQLTGEPSRTTGKLILQ